MKTKASRRALFERLVEIRLFIAATVSFAAVFFIILFVFKEGMPLFKKYSIIEFLFSTNWDPEGTRGTPSFGNFSFIASSFYVTILALVIACPIGIGTGIYMAELANKKTASFMRTIVQLLAGIPSVIFGLAGYLLISPIIRKISNSTTGLSVLTGAIVLAIMILPTLINITEISLQGVKRDLREASLALGASDSHTIFKILLPAAKSGIASGVILAMGRAIGETMAVVMVAGNKEGWSQSIFDETRTMTMNIANGISYASGDYYTSLFTTGSVLFIFIFILNTFSNILIRKAVRNE